MVMKARQAHDQKRGWKEKFGLLAMNNYGTALRNGAEGLLRVRRGEVVVGADDGGWYRRDG